MTGSTSSEGLRPQEISPIPTGASSFPLDLFLEGRTQHHQPRRKMTPIPPNGTPIQLTPLWEHVVRTRRFPSEIDTRAIFVEISERLRDPEWEVRQHALRVLMDVTPTLPAEIVDEVMQPVVPELINNLGHAAPAVRKGALDALRVYLIYSLDREEIVKNILRDGLTRRENNRDNNSFQTNLVTGVILSAPSLLFPSSNTPRPSKDIIKYVTYCLASRLIEIEHQEATLKSLMKIRETIGHGEFDDILSGYDGELKKNLEVLCKVYNVKPSKKSQRKIPLDGKEVAKIENEAQVPGRVWDSDSDTSGIAEEDEEINVPMPPARVVLETEIKFNEETAITMTILEEKARNNYEDNNNDDEGDESGTDVRNENEMTNERSISERRKTPRRVHFGGEIVKLRTPDSDDTESVVVASTKTRIPLPVSPATKMPSERRRSISQPSSPHFTRRYVDRRTSRSLSSSPKREFYTHNAELSPKKGILTRTNNNQLFVIEPIEKKDKRDGKNIDNGEEKRETSLERLDNGLGFESGQENSVNRNFVKGDKKLVRSMSVPIMIENDTTSRESLKVNNEKEKVNNSSEELSLMNRQAVVSSSHENCTDASARPATVDLTGKSIEKESSQSVNPSKIDEKVKDTVRAATTSGIKPPKCETSNVIRKVQSSKVFRRKDVTNVADSDATMSSKYNDAEETRKSRAIDVKNNEDIKNTKEEAQKSQEPSWEELGLVDREVLDDLHNKEDWRARVRGLERVASALRTPSALIAIEPRLGSLLHAVLGGERSCRVAAAGLAVAKIVVTGVTEDALKRRLPQLAWGLARQGGPSAAKLARIAMLRLKPAFLLEQFLQPQCLGARNAKTRENALQLLIFSLVTFPSTEFKVETVAHKVALMVGDRRRRVRQAALDALAVLAQIYDSEEVLRAGKKASAGRHDGEPMFAAIRSRLARKSLPLVSADGLVVYGLQISPTVQIATGPDVDWIVAGSGSVSPGTGRSRRQIATTSRSERGHFLRNKNAKKYTSPWANRQHFFARGVSLRSKPEQPLVWQIVPQNQDDIVPSNEVQELEQNDDIKHNDGHFRATRDNQTANASIKGTNIALNRPKTSLINLDDNANVGSTSVKENIRNVNFQDDGVYRSLSQESSSIKMESKIPILSSRGSNIRLSDQASNISNNSDQLNDKARRTVKLNIRASGLERMHQQRQHLQQETTTPISTMSFGSQVSNQSFDSQHSYRPLSCTTNSNISNDLDQLNGKTRRTVTLNLRASGLKKTYQQRQHLQQETTTPISTMSFGSQVSNQSFDSHSDYRPLSCTINSNRNSERSVLNGQNSSMPKVISHDHLKATDERYSKSSDGYLKYPRTNSEWRSAIEKMETTQQQQTLPAFKISNYPQQRQFPSNPSFTTFKTTPSTQNRIYQDFQNSSHQTMSSRHSSVQSKIDRRTTNDETRQKRGEIEEEMLSGSPTNDHAFVNSPFRRRIRSLSPSGLYQPEKLMGVTFKEIQTASMFDIDKAPVTEEECSERTNNYYLPEANVYPVQVLKSEDSLQEEHEPVKSRSAGSTSSNVSGINSSIRRDRSILKHQQDDDSDSNDNGDPCDDNQKAFDVISRKSEERDTIDSYVLPSKESESSASVESTSTSDETSKDWSSEDGIKRRNETIVLSEQDELLRNDEVANTNNESSDGSDDVDKNTEMRRGSIVSIISSEKMINEVLASSNESFQTNYKNMGKHFQEISVFSPAKHSSSPIRSDLEFNNRAIMTNDSNLDLFGSPRRDLRSPRLSTSFDDHINEILGDVNDDDFISTTFQDETTSFQTLENEKLDKLNNILDSSRDSEEKIAEYVEDNNVESRINENINASIEDVSVYGTTEERVTDVAFTKISTPLETFAKLNDIRNDLESDEAPAILKIKSQPLESTEQPVKRIQSKVPRSTIKSRTVSQNKAIQHSEKKFDKCKPIVQQCFGQLESKDWEVVMKGLKSLSQLAKQHPEYLDTNIGGTIGRLLGRHIRSLRSQVARAACIAAGDIFTSQIRGIDQDIDDIAGPLLHRTADTNRFLRADCNAALDRMVESLPPHKIIGIIVHRGANHQNAIVRGATARLLSSIVDRIGAEHAMILPRDVKDKLIGTGAKLLMDGNLDARNHAKKMFRRLAHCEGFRKALTDAVPETTLRHIDKTLKSL